MAKNNLKIEVGPFLLGLKFKLTILPADANTTSGVYFVGQAYLEGKYIASVMVFCPQADTITLLSRRAPQEILDEPVTLNFEVQLATEAGAYIFKGVMWKEEDEQERYDIEIRLESAILTL